MKIKRILVSQPTPAVAAKSPFNDIAIQHNVDVAFHPFIKVEGVSLREFRTQRIDILSHSAIIFTSRTTIDSFFRLCEEARIAIPESLKYFCNTEAIALYLQKYIVYRKRKIFFADGSFANFIELTMKHKDENFLLTLSEPHKPEMPLAMKKLNLHFNEVILARTVSADLQDVDIREYDMLVFYSPSEITSLLSNFNDISQKHHIATFGHSTTRAALDRGLTISVMAPTSEIPSMTKAIDLYIKRIEAGETIAAVTLEEESPGIAFIQAQEAKPPKRVRSTSKNVAENRLKSTTSTTNIHVKVVKKSATSIGKKSVSASKPIAIKSGTSKSVVKKIDVVTKSVKKL